MLKKKRTVLRDPNRLDEPFSELDLRCSFGLVPRYAYQATDQHFYEASWVIEGIFQAHWGDNWLEILQGLQRPEWDFDEETAKNSNLNRYDMSQYFKNVVRFGTAEHQEQTKQEMEAMNTAFDIQQRKYARKKFLMSVRMGRKYASKWLESPVNIHSEDGMVLFETARQKYNAGQFNDATDYYISAAVKWNKEVMAMLASLPGIDLSALDENFLVLHRAIKEALFRQWKLID